MTKTRLRLRILHLSDLHARGGRESERWRRRRVLGAAWEQNLDALLEDGPIDLVCFTGDAADFGKREEFVEAGEFLLSVLDRLRLERDRLFLVPGNHDIDRSLHPDAWSGLREAVWDVAELDLARWLAGGPAPRGVETAWREQIFERQAAYRAWLHLGLDRGALAPAAGPHGFLGYRITLDQFAVPVHIVGLDTAWLCGDDNDAGKLWATDEQVMRLLTDSEGRPLDGLRLVLQHHPLHELADQARIRAAVAEHADLVLRGHLHDTELSTWADPDHSLRQLAAGCLYEGGRADQWPNACQVVTLELDSGGRPRRTEVRLRSFSPRGGHWFDDDSLYRSSQRGRVSWAVDRPAPSLGNGGGNPFDPWKPAVPPRFQGRQAELRILEAALGRRLGISIVGDSRIGKSSLLLTWQESLEGGGRKVRYLDGQGPEGLSEATFVTRATGRPTPEGADPAASALAAWAEAEPPGLAPVLLVDELDSLPARFDLRFFERLRNLIGGGKIVMVMASRREVHTLFEELERSSPFDNQLRFLRLGLLDEAAAEAVIGFASELDNPARSLMRQWAGRHPLYLQLLGHALVEARRLGESPSAALDRFRDEAEQRLEELWRRLSEREQEALRTCIRGEPVELRSLKRRGLILDDGHPFAEVLTAWLREID